MFLLLYCHRRPITGVAPAWRPCCRRRMIARQRRRAGDYMNRMWAVKIAVTIAIALLSVWVHFASDAQFDALLAPATRDAIHFVLFVLCVDAIIMLGMIGQNLDAVIHRGKSACATMTPTYCCGASARSEIDAVAASLLPEELTRVGFRVYERFRPDVPDGTALRGPAPVTVCLPQCCDSRSVSPPATESSASPTDALRSAPPQIVVMRPGVRCH